MSGSSKIGWADASWNPTTGCSKVSPGCDYCYAETTAKKLHGVGFKEYEDTFGVKTHHHKLSQPLLWKKSKKILVNSMGDLFHPAVPDSFIIDVFKIMGKAPHHVFLLLTKFTERMQDISSKLDWTDNIWAGVSVEDQNYTWRITHLKNIQAKHRFVVFEPLIGPIDNLKINKIEWIIVGGESAKYAREMKLEWVRNIRNTCIDTNTPFYFSKWDKKNIKEYGKTLDGLIWNQFPEPMEKI